ncbi:MAG: T9SS type A sorting domain-containing protein [Bacteroidota bacterium]
MFRIFFFSLCVGLSCLSAQTFSVQVNEGHGAGRYLAGDTVYIFSRTLGDYEVFTSWTIPGNQVSFVADEGEWRGAFIMPNRNVVLTANFDTVPADFLRLEPIRTTSIAQPFYTAFQPNHKGTVFLLHGSGGGASGWANPDRGDGFQVAKDLYYAGYSVVIPECQESTAGMDLNGDGRIRWVSFPMDTLNNIDYQNLNIAIDSFARRGDLERNQLYSIGMSSGGGFSGAFSVTFSTRASAVYCASSQEIVADTTQADLLFCLMPFDEAIGPDGIVDARMNHQTMVNRGLCSQFFLNQPFPIYPAIFERAQVDSMISMLLFQELANNQFITSKHFLTDPVSEIERDIQSNLGNWPAFRSLSSIQINQVRSLLQVAYGEHKFFANHNKRTIQFFDDPCGLVSSNFPEATQSAFLKVAPNPTSRKVEVTGIKPPFDWEVFGQDGRLLRNGKTWQHTSIELPIASGIYLLRVRAGSEVFSRKIVKR